MLLLAFCGNQITCILPLYWQLQPSFHAYRFTLWKHMASCLYLFTYTCQKQCASKLLL
jgi:hypothetical protein